MGSVEEDLRSYERAQYLEARKEAAELRAYETMQCVIFYGHSFTEDGWYYQVQNRVRRPSMSDIIDTDGPFDSFQEAEDLGLHAQQSEAESRVATYESDQRA